jgi:hypothetical protein
MQIFYRRFTARRIGSTWPDGCPHALMSWSEFPILEGSF